MAYEDYDLTWWQRLLVKAKIWQPLYQTEHHRLREMPAPVPPPVTGAYGNKVVTGERTRRVPQRQDHQRPPAAN